MDIPLSSFGVLEIQTFEDEGKAGGVQGEGWFWPGGDFESSFFDTFVPNA
jgi:hypothetical protein